MLALPSALLALIAISAPLVASEPYNPPAHVKYYPEDEVLVKRGLSAMQELATRSPTGARKMTEDEEEMFFMDYWQFEEHAHTMQRRSTAGEYQNQTLDGSLLPPLLLHTASNGQEHLWNGIHILPRGKSFKRDFQCPAGTNNCNSIQRPNSCCATGETCVKVTDTGLGDVGCCPQGQNCGSTISNCDTNAGYKSCPGSTNGGCCIPDFDCFDIGCAINTTSTTTTTLPVVTVTTCPASYSSCPASVGGGCCTNGAACGTSNSCLTSSPSSTTMPTTSTTTTTISPTAAAAPPARPTGTTGTTDSSADATIPLTTTVGTQLVAVCPTNYYFCSAYYRPGCCRIGRDCALSNCPAAASSSTMVSNGVTVVVPVGATTGGQSYVSTALITSTGNAGPTTTLRGGACQVGWASCATDVGGGCCPPNFACGTSCTATAGGATGVVAKVEPNSATGATAGIQDVMWKVWVFVMMGLGIGVMMAS